MLLIKNVKNTKIIYKKSKTEKQKNQLIMMMVQIVKLKNKIKD
jgi:hypothetical protein